MSRINTNISSLTAQRVLGQNNFNLNTSLSRLSTGLRITRGKDDPAGLIASENLRSDIKSLNSAVSNAERADQVINIAEGGLQEISSLLSELQGLVTASASQAGLSKEEKEANQLQIDSILQTIDRISGSTAFQGTKLLNGNFDYQVSGVDSGVTDFKINGAKFEGTSYDVSAIVTQSAQQAGLFVDLGTSGTGGTGTIDLATGSAFVIEIQGTKGARELSFSSGQSLDTIAATINSLTDVTGVTATVSGTGIRLESSEYGSNEFVSIKVASDSGTLTNAASSSTFGVNQLDASDFSVATGSATAFSAATNPVRDEGQDVRGTINGVIATGVGRTLAVNTDFLDVSVTLDASTAQTLDSVDVFSITGGGADFQLAGKVNIAGRVSVGIGDISTRKLGNSDVGFLDDLGSGKSFNVVDATSGDLTTAQDIISQAIKDVSSTRGRLGAFQKNVIGATIRSLGVAVENTSAAESVIRDADFAAETAGLTRNQILASASTNVLALANQQPQQVLQLLG
jgi:flagellin